MSEYDNNNTGALFKNKRREHDKQPEYTGNCEVNNVDYWISAWVRESKSGEKFFSISFTPKEQKSNVVQPAPQEDVNSEIPF